LETEFGIPRDGDPFERLLSKAAEFHGHLGPYLVIGLRMGLLAKGLLGADGMNGLSAGLETGQLPPISCVADGVQISTLCTLGKGNIRIEGSGKVRGRFEAHGRAVAIELNEGVERRVEELLRDGGSMMAVGEIKALRDRDLFEVRRISEGGGAVPIHAETNNR
jgi:formylmethanofuran dehydrogenase subunit E